MADGASIAQLSLASIIEVTRGTTPTTPGYTYLPIRQGSFLQVDKNFEQSTLIRNDRNPGTRIGGVAGSSGTISMPLVRETGFTQWLESALSGTYATVTHTAVTGTFAASGSTFTRGSGSWLTDAIVNRFEVGDLLFPAGTTSNQTTLNMGGTLNATDTTITVTATTTFETTGWIKIENEIITYTGKTGTTFTGCTRGALGTTAATHADTTAVLHGIVISAVTATVLTFSGYTLTDEASVSTTFTTTTRILVPGTTRKFYSVEQKFNDIGPLYEIFKGVEDNTAQFSCPTSGEIGVEFAVLGTNYATGQVGGSTYTNTSGNNPFAASTAGSVLRVDGAALAGCVENLQFTVNNNRALKYGVGEQFACFVEEGTRQIDLTFGLYLVDGTFQDKFQDETRFALKLLATSPPLITTLPAGDKFSFYWPKLVITSLPRAVSGQTIVENVSASAEYDSTTGTAFYVREHRLS